jgi:ArsR family transcriptional regulator
VRRGRAALPPDEEIRDTSDTFKVLAHPTRVKMIRALAGGELCVCEISEVIGLSVSATSHQLHQLRDLRIVRSRTEGKLVHYSIQAPFVVALLDSCTRHISGRQKRA